MTKRLFDLLLVIPGILVVAPVMLVLGIIVKLDSSGPAIFRQERVGRLGIPFQLLKFRSMSEDAESSGPKITIAGDSRITRAGRFLRKIKLDELPQLINVLLGDMSLVGPRPEVQKYIDLYTKEQQDTVLSVRPGITDRAAIVFRNESEMLARSDDPEAYYADEILPEKIRLYEQYVSSHSVAGDCAIIVATIGAILRPH